MMPNDVILVALLSLLGPFAPAPVSGHCKFPAIFSFGDSNADSGGLSLMFGPVSPPYGSTFFARPEGRFSDGRLIIDFMGTQVLPLFLPENVYCVLFLHCSLLLQRRV